MSFRRNNRRQGRSLHYRDPFRSLAPDRKEQIESLYGGDKLYIENKDLQSYFEPYNESMNESIALIHADPLIEKVLKKHLFGDGSSSSLGIELGFVHRLLHLFGYMLADTFIYNHSYAEVVWDEVSIGDNQSLWLPIELVMIPPETMKSIRGRKFKQSYSFLSRTKVFGNFKYQKSIFESDEILKFTWPFTNKPHWHNLKPYYKTKINYLKFHLMRSELSATLNNKSFRLLRASQKSSSHEQALYIQSSLKLRRSMRILGYVDGFIPTNKYDAYLLYQYYRDKSLAINKYFQDFNDQVLFHFAMKNNLTEQPMLVYRGKYNLIYIDECYQDYSSKKISYEEFLSKLTNNTIS